MDVLGILGASGGLGVSTLVVALAQRAARILGPTVCVDGHVGSGGLDVTACVEHLPGLRWGDLAGLRGRVDGPGLMAGLPAEGAVRILSHGAGATPDAPVLEAVLEALREASGLTVVDLPPGAELRERLLSHCDGVLLLGGLSARHLADATAQARVLTAAGTPQAWLVVRGSRRDRDLPEEVAAHLDLPLAGVWADDPRVASDAEQARCPGTRSRGALAVLADRLLIEALPRFGAPLPTVGLTRAGGR